MNNFVKNVFFGLFILSTMSYGFHFSDLVRNKKPHYFVVDDWIEIKNHTFVKQTDEQAKIRNAKEIIKGFKPKISDKEVHLIASLLYDESILIDVPYTYLLAIMATESRFNPRVISRVGARGLMQLMPGTFKYVSRVSGYNYTTADMFNIEKNIKVGCLYIAMLYESFGDLDLVAAGYNGGPGTAKRYIQYKGGKRVSVPRETLKYVIKVNEYEKLFKTFIGE